SLGVESTGSESGQTPEFRCTVSPPGVHTFSATLKTAGSQSLSATDTLTSSINGTQAITVQAAAASSLRLAGFPSPSQAGVPGSRPDGRRVGKGGSVRRCTADCRSET